jgi:hypothetical protein
MSNQIKIFIADDNIDIVDSLEETILVEIEKFGLTDKNVIIRKAFTEHAYEHGSQAIREGFVPDICIFDLVFNGSTGVDLYKYILNSLSGRDIHLCIYTGIEKRLEKIKEAEILSSKTNLIKIIEKPNITKVLEWFGEILIDKYGLSKIIEEKDPFDIL